MKFIQRLQILPLNQRLIILWLTIIIVGVAFSAWRINYLKPKFENLTRINVQEEIGIVSHKENIEELREGYGLIKESTESIKESFDFIKELTNELKNMEEIPESLDFLMQNNEN